MRREFGGRSSNEGKAHMKRSSGNDAEEKVQAMSPYHSREDLSSMIDQHDDGTVQTVDDLDSRVAATREAAHRTILLHLSRNSADSALRGSAATIALRGCQWLTNARTNTAAKMDGVDLACATMLCCADDDPKLYDETALSLFSWLSHPSAAKQPSSLIGKVMETLSLVMASNPQCMVGDVPLHDALHQSDDGSSWVDYFTKAGDAKALGAIALGLAATCNVTSRSRVRTFVRGSIKSIVKRSATGSPDGAALVPAVRSLGILEDRFKGTISLEEAEELVEELQGWDKDVSTEVRKLLAVLEASVAPTPASGGETAPTTSPTTTTSSATANLDPAAGVSPVGSCGGLEVPSSPNTRQPTLKNRAAPFEFIQFRERSVTFEGYYRVYLLEALRDVVSEGLLNHIAHNPTVRRMFDVKMDLITKMTKEEAALEKDAMSARKAEKEAQFRERSKDRRRKHTAQRELGGEEDDD